MWFTDQMTEFMQQCFGSSDGKRLVVNILKENFSHIVIAVIGYFSRPSMAVVRIITSPPTVAKL